MKNPFIWPALLAQLLLACPQSARGAERVVEVQRALSTPAFPAELPLAEIKSFIEPRIAQPPIARDGTDWERQAAQLRRDLLEQIVFRGAASRWREHPVEVDWLETIPGGPGYRIKKFRYEALPGMWIPALLYEPEEMQQPVPLALHVNGHDPLGKATPYKQLRSINLSKRGMLVIDLEWFGMGQLRTDGFSHGRMNQLELCGASGLAPFYLAMQRALDVGLALEQVDSHRVAVAGLSGGGWQTILISSLDERVTLANPVAGYASFHTNLAFGDLGDSEQAPSDMAALADYTHLTALRAPRPTLLTYNAKDDCCFKSGHALAPLVRSARPIYALFGATEMLRTHVNHEPGTHNFERENRERYYAMIGDHFFPGRRSYRPQEIDSEADLKTQEQLRVDLPDGNVDFQVLAKSLAADLPKRELPNTVAAARQWQAESRDRLGKLLRIPTYQVSWQASAAASDLPDWSKTYRLRVGGQWSIPVTEFAPPEASPKNEIALFIADDGRAKHAPEIEQLSSNGYRVIALDPLLWGESEPKGSDPAYLFALLLNSVGTRPLGVQAAQLVAVARYVRSEYDAPLTVFATGPRSATAALIAAGLESVAIDAVEITGGLASFHELLERNIPVETMPELFAFGLLVEFDVRELLALAAPRKVRFHGPNERLERTFEGLEAWTEVLGQPLQSVR